MLSALTGVVLMAAALTAEADMAIARVNSDQAQYQDLAGRIETWGLSGIDCTDPQLISMSNEVDQFETKITSAAGVSLVLPYMGDLKTKYASWTADLQLKVADAMLKRGCPELADLVYRAILERYPGMNYQSFRERAKVGIDDVRSAKQDAH